MKTCFIIMPYGGEDEQLQRHFLGVYQSILGPAAERAGYQPKRSDLGDGPGNITSEIIRDLVEADVVLADLTDGNANVLFELGIRHVFRKSGTVHVVDEAGPIPFDIRAYRAVKYSTDLADIPGIIDEIVKAIRRREDEPDRSDNPVHDTIHGLPVDFRHVGDEAQIQQIQELQQSVEQLSRERDDLDQKLAELDPSGSVRRQPSDLDVDVLLDQADQVMKSTGEYVLLRLSSVAESGGRDAFVAELRSVLKSPYLSQNDFLSIARMCSTLDLVDHRRVALEIAHTRYPHDEDLFLAMIDAYDDSPAPAIQERGRKMLEEFLHVERDEADGNPRVSTSSRSTGSADVAGLLFNFYFRQGRPEWVLSICDSWAQEPAEVIVARNRARALASLHRREEAEQAFQDVLQLGEDALGYQWFGDFLDGEGRYEDAYRTIERGVMAAPERANGYLTLAVQILNRRLVRESDGGLVRVSRDDALRAAVPVILTAVERGNMATRQQAVNILIARDAVNEAQTVAAGGLPDPAAYDTRTADYIRTQVAARPEAQGESE
jgi:tetratricopeptide (TPR) repeat protein